MTRFYVPPAQVKDAKIEINGAEAHHAIDVMRLADGDKVVVFDGTGAEYTGFIDKLDKKKKKIIVEVIRKEVPPAEEMPHVVLAQAIPKKHRMDYVVEKATELGVSEIIPLISERTLPRPEEASCIKKQTRWSRIAQAASKQCGRLDIPEIREILHFGDMIEKIDQYDLVLVACLGEGAIPIKEALKNFTSGKILVFIGPEGDFTSAEIESAKRANCRLISLGRRILKSDTAPLYVLSAINYEMT